MTNENTNNSADESLQPIPKEQQNISTEEIVEAEYNVAPSSTSQESEPGTRRVHDYGSMEPPGRMRNDDSIEASSEEVGGTSHGHEYSAGYESQMATRIGDEEVSDAEIDRLRELHEGRHRSDGEHSVRESQRDKERISQAICSSLSLTSKESEAVITVVQDLDFTQFGHQKGLIRVTLGVVSVLVDEQIRETGPGEDDFISWSDEYREICRKHDISMSDLSTIKEKVREALDEGEVIPEKGTPKRDPALPGPTPRDELPENYWTERRPEYWVSVAKHWNHYSETRKEAIPGKYRKLVIQLRQWKPWQDTEDQVDGKPSSTDEGDTLDAGTRETLEEAEATIEQELENIDQELEDGDTSELLDEASLDE
ncbi:hypothetical protein [Halostella litorea]|uniref:hypothetical protein n=1 Tax=Halostella litorea TaxID=2528831 RepID=UPI001093317C|nr:hypothetical protein [Halostella litorea]